MFTYSGSSSACCHDICPQSQTKTRFNNFPRRFCRNPLLHIRHTRGNAEWRGSGSMAIADDCLSRRRQSEANFWTARAFTVDVTIEIIIWGEFGFLWTDYYLRVGRGRPGECIMSICFCRNWLSFVDALTILELRLITLGWLTRLRYRALDQCTRVLHRKLSFSFYLHLLPHAGYKSWSPAKCEPSRLIS